jgi:predicted nuclease with TOPRIM domain
MAMSQEDKQEFKELLAPILDELKDLKQTQAEMCAELKALKQGQAGMGAELNTLKRGQARLEKKMDEGFKFLETCINEAAVDIGKTNKRLREHVELPIH